MHVRARGAVAGRRHWRQQHLRLGSVLESCRLVFTPLGWEDYGYWQATDKATLKRLNRLLDEALRDPFAGVGKPEPLRHVLAGWSRRIDEEHRLVYLVDGDDVVVLQARYHYES